MPKPKSVRQLIDITLCEYSKLYLCQCYLFHRVSEYLLVLVIQLSMVWKKIMPDVIGLLKLVEQGDAKAQYELGVCYYTGDGVKKDYTRAVRWFTKSAEQGNAEAQFNLGNCYYFGYGVKKNYTQTAMWFTKAAEQVHVNSQYEIGLCYYHGVGVKQDYVKAVSWFAKAAEQGNVTAQYCLGACYYAGKGVEKDYARAAVWFSKAARQGNVDAENMLHSISQSNLISPFDLQHIIEVQQNPEEQLNLELEQSKQRLVNLSTTYSNGKVSEAVFIVTSKKLESKITSLEAIKTSGNFDAYVFNEAHHTLDGADSSQQHAKKQPSGAWYLMPLLFFGLLGGVIGYLGVKDRDKDMAEGLLAFGVLISIITFVFGWWLAVS